MRVRRRELDRTLDALEHQLTDALTELRWIRDHADAISQRVAADVDDGTHGIDYAAVRRGGGDATGPEAAVLARRRDETIAQATKLVTAIRKSAHQVLELRKEAKRARDAAEQLLPMEHDKASTLALATPATSTATCANPACIIVPAGTRKDRLTSGRCFNCYRYRLTHGHDRPRDLCNADAITRGQLAVEPSTT